MDDFDLAIALSLASHTEESDYYRNDDQALESALQASMNSYEEELAVQAMLEQTNVSEAQTPKNPNQKNQNDCLDVAFKILFQHHYKYEFPGNVRDEIRMIAKDRFGNGVDLELYELADGQQLSLHVFEMILEQYNLRVTYIRPSQPIQFIGSPLHYPIQGLAIHHTVNADYGAQGDARYAGHYEVVRF